MAVGLSDDDQYAGCDGGSLYHLLMKEKGCGKQTDNGYHRWIHRFGISSSLLLFVAMTAFPVAISFVYGIWPDFKALWPGFVAVILFMAPYWPAETIGYMSVMGPGALYMFLHYRKCYKSQNAGNDWND